MNSKYAHKCIPLYLERHQNKTGTTHAYLSLCELCELGHSQFHLALLRTRRVWRCGLWLWRWPWSCCHLLSCRHCSSTRYSCWNRLSSDDLSHYLLGLTCTEAPTLVILKKHCYHKSYWKIIANDCISQPTNPNGQNNAISGMVSIDL